MTSPPIVAHIGPAVTPRNWTFTVRPVTGAHPTPAGAPDADPIGAPTRMTVIAAYREPVTTPSGLPAITRPAAAAETVAHGCATVSVALSMTRGMVEAEDRGLGRPVAIGIAGEHVEVSLHLVDLLEWWRDILGFPNSFVDHWPAHGYAQVAGEFDGCPWVLKPIIEPCTAGSLCGRCRELGAATVRVNTRGEITPAERRLDWYGHHRQTVVAAQQWRPSPQRRTAAS